MTTPQLVLLRYTELVSKGAIDQATHYLDEGIVYHTWMGVIEGKDNVITFLKDDVRFMHHHRNFNRWQQVQHSLDPRLGALDDTSTTVNSSGYDSQGYATFERDGTIASRAKYAMTKFRVKETVVIHNDRIILVTLLRQL